MCMVIDTIDVYDVDIKKQTDSKWKSYVAFT